MTERSSSATNTDRTQAEVAERATLRLAIVSNLARQPAEDQTLRTDVWTYVGFERHAGTSPGHVITALTSLIAAADVKPATKRQALMRRVILWGVEAYFGHLDGDVMGRDGDAFSDSPAAAAWPVNVPSARRAAPALPAGVPARRSEERGRALTHNPLATPEAIAREAPGFPSASAAEPEESWYVDWRLRLSRNLSRRSDGRWEPLTWFHAATASETI
jgi:hypothetical protein